MDTLIAIGLALLCIQFGHAQDPTVKITQTDPPQKDPGTPIVLGIRDKDLTMDCYVENLLDNAQVRWQRLHRVGSQLQTQLISQNVALDNNIHYSIEKPTQFTWRLRVRTIQVSDEGNYMCFVQVTLSSIVYDNRTVQVVFAPYLDLSLTTPDTSLFAGDSADLVCNATAKPPPLIEWSRLGGSLLPIGQEKYKGVTLKLVNVRPEDRGIYRCTAMNFVGTVIHDVNLKIQFAPVVYTPRRTVLQAVGYRVELQCVADANPLPSISDNQVAWVRGTTTYSQSSANYVVKYLQGAFNRLSYELVIVSVRPQDFGTYTCRIANTRGTSTATITLQQTNVPQPSVKLGRVVPGNEPLAEQDVASAAVFKATLVLSLCAVLLAILIVH